MPRDIQRAFVTGATGLIGRAIVHALRADGVAVRALLVPGADASGLNLPDDDVLRGDISDVGPLARGLAGSDVCFHAAAMNALQLRSRGAIRRQYDINVKGTRTLLKTAVTAACPRVVIAGTAAILRPPEVQTAATEDQLAPESAHAIHWLRSRLEAEQLALKEEGVDVVIASITHLLGPNDRRPAPLGGLVRAFLRGELRAFPDAPVNVLDARDCARGQILAAIRGRPGRRYILGGENLTLLELLRGLAQHANVAEPVGPAPVGRTLLGAAWRELIAKVKGEPAERSLAETRLLLGGHHCDTSRAKAELGFEARPLNETLKDAVEWYA
jgi:dihydroflavonol-4-reductase